MIKCSYCGNEPEWVENKEVYGKNYGRSYMIWLCKPCNAYVGCHNNTRMPLGTLAKKPLRELRMRCHKLIDELWNDNESRQKLYDGLSVAMGVTDLHIGSSDENMCKQIIEYIERCDV